MTLVSIISPVFNRAMDLPKMIGSVLIQSHDNWELLLIDDGSDDSSLKVANRYALSDDRIKVRKRERAPKGASTCRNVGIEMARGDYVMFLDSDDLLSTNCLKNRIELSGLADRDFIVTQTGIIRRENLEVRKIWSSLKHEDDIVAFTKLQGWCVSSTFFRSGFVKKYEFDEKAPCLQDWGFHLTILTDKPKYTKYADSAVDVYIRSGHGGTRISITTNNFERLVPRFHVFLRMEEELSRKNMSKAIYAIDKQYLKHLNFAVLELDRNHFLKLFELWKRSLTFTSRNGILIRRYLCIQYFFKRMRLSFVRGLVYRLAKLLYPKDLFEPNNRECLLKTPFVVEGEIQSLLKSTD